jgi:hypothetical protein
MICPHCDCWADDGDFYKMPLCVEREVEGRGCGERVTEKKHTYACPGCRKLFIER